MEELDSLVANARFIKKNPFLSPFWNGWENDYIVAHLRWAIQEYSMLPAMIVPLLWQAYRHAKPDSPVSKELWRNIQEELGSKTGGLSHYTILTQGLWAELKIDIRNYQPSRETDLFLRELSSAIEAKGRAYAFGVAYALEATAVPELTVVTSVINSYGSLGWRGAVIDTGYPRDNDGMISLDEFFRRHIDEFEPGHKNQLRDAIDEYLNGCRTLVPTLGFEKGFRRTLDLMEDWWEHLANPPQDL